MDCVGVVEEMGKVCARNEAGVERDWRVKWVGSVQGLGGVLGGSGNQWCRDCAVM